MINLAGPTSIVGIVIGLAFVMCILFTIIVAPIWVVAHYVTRWRQAPSLAAADEKLLSDLWEIARRLESRMGNLERVVGPFDAKAGVGR